MLQIDSTAQSAIRNDYLDLLEKVILNTINPENGARIHYLLEQLTTPGLSVRDWNTLVRNLVSVHRNDRRMAAALSQVHAAEHWWTNVLGFPLSMTGPQRLRNVRIAAETVIAEQIPGAMVETGVWRGGACLMMKGVMHALGDRRALYVCDSFEGLPPIDSGPDKGLNLHELPILSASVEDVQSHFERLGLLDEHVHFVKGWFSDTMAGVRTATEANGIAVLRLDGDYYKSTLDVLVPLCPLVAQGGFVIIDDYHAFEQCRQATDEYRAAHGICAPIIDIDEMGVYWRVGARP